MSLITLIYSVVILIIISFLVFCFSFCFDLEQGPRKEKSKKVLKEERIFSTLLVSLVVLLIFKTLELITSYCGRNGTKITRVFY